MCLYYSLPKDTGSSQNQYTNNYKSSKIVPSTMHSFKYFWTINVVSSNQIMITKVNIHRRRLRLTGTTEELADFIRVFAKKESLQIVTSRRLVGQVSTRSYGSADARILVGQDPAERPYIIAVHGTNKADMIREHHAQTCTC